MPGFTLYATIQRSFQHSYAKYHSDVTVTKQEDKFRHASIRSEHCVPPLSDSNKHFYFEVTVLNKSDSKYAVALHKI